MAGYIEKRLYEGEILRYRGKFHWIAYARAWLALIVLGIIIFGIVYFIMEMVRINTTEFVVTDRRVVLKTGLWSADVEEIALDAIEGSSLKQGILGRIFGYGRLSINGRGETHIRFPNMAHPQEFRAQAEKAKQTAPSQV
ncbi:MAG: PH domain-containing protein [Hyphomonas sp.]|nr:PH domain-containing protein [Hyphomonas sp.]